jgi:SAM-dependent methyltransferase
MTGLAAHGDAHDPDSEFTGKYETEGRAGRWLVDRFYAAVRGLLLPQVKPGDIVLEIGCGAGYSSLNLLECLPAGVDFVGSDVGETLLHKARFRNPGIAFVRQSVYDLALPDRSVDVVVMLEVLEHLESPVKALAEVHRVVRKAAIISTPREPLWRALNFLRGKYVRELGNTPGHIQHWSSRGLRREAEGLFRVTGVSQPVPWTVLSLAPRR